MFKKINLALFTSSLCLSTLILAGCGGGTTDGGSTDPGTVTTPTDGSQSVTALSGNAISCALLTSAAGSNLNGLAYTRSLTLSTNGTYTLTTDLTDGTSCLAGHQSGGSGVVYFQINASGTWTVGGTNTTPSTSTKMTFTETAQTFTIYSPTSPNIAYQIAVWANACTGQTSGFSLTATSHSNGFFGGICSANGGINLGASAALNTIGYNVGYRNSTLQTGTLANIYDMNAGSYPTSYGVQWY